jgi:hypothetical protein
MFHLRALLALIAALSLFTPTSWAQESPEALSEKLIIAMTAKKESTLKGLWDAGKWSKSSDNDGYRLYSQAQRKQFELSQQAIQAKGDRAVITMDISVQGVVRDRIFLNATATNGSWKFHAIHESPELAAAFLDGHVEARFAVENLPADKDLLEQGKALLARLAKGEPAPPDDPATALLARLQGKHGLRVQYARVVQSIGRGVVAFSFYEENEGAGTKERFEETIVGYFDRQEASWVVYDSGYYPTPSTLFRELGAEQE